MEERQLENAKAKVNTGTWTKEQARKHLYCLPCLGDRSKDAIRNKFNQVLKGD
jgi:hypothetical protein